ncbi:MAG: hypothetical protein ACRBN8_12120 [Nannocystales bacterium]
MSGTGAFTLAMSLCAAVGAASGPASETVTIDAPGVDTDSLASELRLRAPKLKVITPGAPAPSDGSTTLHVRTQGQGYELLLVMDDGRIFRRTVPAEPDDAARVIAAAAANLLAGVAEGQLVPDEDPGSSVLPPPTEPEAETSEETPAPSDAAPPPPEVADPPLPAAEPHPPATDGTRWRGTVEAITTVGAGPNASEARWGGPGARLRLGLRLDEWTVDGGLSYLGWQRRGAALHRFGGQLGLAYSWRRSGFELEARAHLALEGWRAVAESAKLVSDDAPVPGLLLGPGIGVSPLWWLKPSASPLRVGLGPTVGVSYTGDPRAGWASGRLHPPDGAASLAIGGAEVWLGLRLTLARR